jgi:hypothetical protein
VIRVLPIALVLLVAALPVTAQTPPRRRPPVAPLQGDEPEIEDDDQDGEQAVPDQPDDDPREEQHALPGAPRRDAPQLPSSPQDEEEEPSAPPERQPPPEGAAEPASAMQPLSPE